MRIEGRDLPGRSCGPGPDFPGGHPNIHVGVQRKNKPGELLDLTPGDARSVTWTIECATKATSDGVDVTGPYVSGGPGERFVYLSWGVVGDDGSFTMFRRAKLKLATVPPAVISAAVERGVLVGRLGLTDENGNPRCASIDDLEWSAASS